MHFLPPWPSERLSIQPDAWGAERRRSRRIHRGPGGECLSGKTYAQRVVSRRTLDSRIPCRGARTGDCRGAGATHTIHTGHEPLHERLADLTSGQGPDVVVEAIGLPQTFRAAVEEVAFTGRVVYIGYVKEPLSYETRLFVQKELDILGSRNALPEDFHAVIRMLEEHRFPVDDAVSSIVALDDAPEALRSWSDDPSRVKKIMVRLD
jgi:D-arabinose 1-dehydrogenase-like Zn-dependent alcohol dehydrogenase